MVRWGDYVQRNGYTNQGNHKSPYTGRSGFSVTRATLPGYKHPRLLVSTCPSFTVSLSSSTSRSTASTTRKSAYNFDDLQRAIAQLPKTPRYDAMRRQRVTPPLLCRLPADTDECLRKALLIKDRQAVLNGEAARVPITADDLMTLSGCHWLNDEVINGHLSLQVDHYNHTSSGSVNRAWTFTTFFMTKLRQSGYEGVRRWTRTVDLFACKYVLVPVHLGNHWTLLVVNNHDHTLSYYDGLGGKNETDLAMMLEYLHCEWLTRKAQKPSPPPYTVKYPPAPRQQNGHDCGVFLLVYARCVLLDLHNDDDDDDMRSSFHQRDMPYFRRRIMYELVHNKLLS